MIYEYFELKRKKFKLKQYNYLKKTLYPHVSSKISFFERTICYVMRYQDGDNSNKGTTSFYFKYLAKYVAY